MKVVLEALKERQTLAELSQEYELSPQQISTWKREFIEGAESVFGATGKGVKTEAEIEKETLLKTIGELKVANDFLTSLAERRGLIRRGHSKLSIQQQCTLLKVHRSGYYYKPKGESQLNLELMRLMDEHYLEYSFKGAPMMHA